MAIKPLEIEISFEKKNIFKHSLSQSSVEKKWVRKNQGVLATCDVALWCSFTRKSWIPSNQYASKKNKPDKQFSSTRWLLSLFPTTTSERFFCQEKNVDKIKPVYSLPKKNAKQSSQSKDSCFLCFPSTTGEVDTSAVCQKPWETNRRL